MQPIGLFDDSLLITEWFDSSIAAWFDDSLIHVTEVTPEPEVAVISGGGIGHTKGKRRNRLFIVEVDGITHRVYENNLNNFLVAVHEKQVKPNKNKKVKNEVKKDAEITPKFDIQFIPDTYDIDFDISGISSNIQKMFNESIARYKQNIDDEESILVLT